MYEPSEVSQMTTPMRLQKPISAASSGFGKYGVDERAWVDIEGVIWTNFKSFGGTEITDNGILSVEDTANITCRFDPNIKSKCRLIRLSDNAVFEIIGEPENIEMRNKYLKFKIRRIKGGA